jgi:hypothetical protein
MWLASHERTAAKVKHATAEQDPIAPTRERVSRRLAFEIARRARAAAISGTGDRAGAPSQTCATNVARRAKKSVARVQRCNARVDVEFPIPPLFVAPQPSGDVCTICRLNFQDARG